MVSCPQCHVDGARIVHCTNGTIVYECPLCNYFFLVKPPDIVLNHDRPGIADGKGSSFTVENKPIGHR
jgi:hypothetical protein